MTSKTPLLDRVVTPAQLRQLDPSDLRQLADELRQETIDAVSVTGGHLGAGLGVVELTVAIHYVFDTPYDRLIWDVGHQAYPHKILTGRRDRIRTLRQGGGLSGFVKRSESEYDPFGTAHSSTSISAALGMAVASEMQGRKRACIAVIGDGSMSAGMAYEAMNNAGSLDTKLIVILNDNNMSIAPPVGALSAYLSRSLSSTSFRSLRHFAKDTLRILPDRLQKMAARAEEYARGIISGGGTLFEELGFYYVGPIDGHNIDHLLPVLQNLANSDEPGPVLVHVVTQKGKGYAPAEASADRYHGVVKFDVATGVQQKSAPKAPSYTGVYAKALIAEARADDRIVAVTAAMPSGTGLDAFGKEFPKRTFDVGIARQQQQQGAAPPRKTAAAASAPPSSTTTPSAKLALLGDGTLIVQDFVGGLKELYARAKARPEKMGFVDNFGVKILVLSEPEHIKTTLNKVTAHALWGGIKPASEAFFGKSVLFVLEGEEWRKLRALMRSAFQLQKLELMKADVTSTALDLCNRLEDAAAEGRVVDMNAALSMYHLSAVGKTTFNYTLDVFQRFPASNEISDSFEYLLAELPRRSFAVDQALREDYTTPTPDNLKWQAAAGTVRGVVLKAIKNRLDDQRNGAPPRGDLLDSMIQSYRDASGAALSSVSKEAEAHILLASLGDNLVEMFFAGYNTSAVAMGVALYFLSKPENRKFLDQVQEEIDSILVDEIPQGKGLNPKDFPTLVRVFNESLRVVPPAPLVARLVTEDLDVGNVTIAANTPVWIPAVAAQMDPDHWGKDAAEFNPDRWHNPPKPGSYTPFSGGARDCIGKFFAELESVTALAVLLQTYEFEIAPGYQFVPLFTGFGYRPFDAASQRVCVNLIPKKRLDASTNLYEWSTPRAKGSSMLRGADEE